MVSLFQLPGNTHKGYAMMKKHEEHEKHEKHEKKHEKMHKDKEHAPKKKHKKKPTKAKEKVSKVMREFEAGKLHSGSKKGPQVTNPKQAIAIGLSEARKKGAKIPKKKK
jgi:pyruvate/2-oxoglutarate dehydrogenase complex dihydrolipoamide acyltransferase (E2) component